MSRLTHIEKKKLERELGMGSGYVLDFSNRTFEEFFREVVGVQIYDPQFELGSGSKANRMRAFWQIANEEQLRSLLGGLLEAWDLYANAQMPESAQELLTKILTRLGGTVTGVPEQEEDTTSSTARLGEELSIKLGSRLLEVTALHPQKRGYEFERFLQSLFDAYNLSARASFRLTGEQIDGSFVLHNETYDITRSQVAERSNRRGGSSHV